MSISVFGGKCAGIAFCEGTLYDTLISNAITLLATRYPEHPILKKPLRFFAEELKWIAQQGIETMQEYEEAERTGRSLPVERKNRQIIYRVLEAYRGLRKNAGKTYD